jgi:hypothetical protein
MKKFPFVLIALLVGLGFAGWYFAPDRLPPFLHPEGRACQRVASLCNQPPTDCENAFAELRKASGTQSIYPPIKCVMSADSCAESIGCVAGGGVNAIIKNGSEFLRGLQNSVGK